VAVLDEDPWFASIKCDDLIREDKIADALDVVEASLGASDAPDQWRVGVTQFVAEIRRAEDLVAQAVPLELSGQHESALPLWDEAKKHAAAAAEISFPLSIERYGQTIAMFQTLDPWAKLSSAYRASIIRRRIRAYDAAP
jgi:hypothetical protein